MSLTSELLPLPRDAGDADEGAERDVDGDVFEVVVAGADDAKRRLRVASCEFAGDSP